MPRLLLFAACERIILADDNTVSLISLLEKMEMTAHVAPGEPPPAGDAMSPFSWNVLATWTREDGDQDGVFFSPAGPARYARRIYADSIGIPIAI